MVFPMWRSLCPVDFLQHAIHKAQTSNHGRRCLAANMCIQMPSVFMLCVRHATECVVMCPSMPGDAMGGELAKESGGA